MALTCCPTDYYYIDNFGVYADPTFGLLSILNTSGSTPSYSLCLNKCGRIPNAGFAPDGGVVTELIDTIECPCCPLGFEYDRVHASTYPDLPCHSTIYFDLWGPSVDCLICVCPPPDTPPECLSCQIAPIHINFSTNIDSKVCNDCNKDDGTLPSDKRLTNFIASLLINPVLNFKLK